MRKADFGQSLPTRRAARAAGVEPLHLPQIHEDPPSPKPDAVLHNRLHRPQRRRMKVPLVLQPLHRPVARPGRTRSQGRMIARVGRSGKADRDYRPRPCSPPARKLPFIGWGWRAFAEVWQVVHHERPGRVAALKIATDQASPRLTPPAAGHATRRWINFRRARQLHRGLTLTDIRYTVLVVWLGMRVTGASQGFRRLPRWRWWANRNRIQLPERSRPPGELNWIIFPRRYLKKGQLKRSSFLSISILPNAQRSRRALSLYS